MTYLCVNWYLSGDSKKSYYDALYCINLHKKYEIRILCKLYQQKFYYPLICLYYIFKQIYRNYVFSCVVLFIFWPQQSLMSYFFPLFCILSSCFLSCGIYFKIKNNSCFYFGILKVSILHFTNEEEEMRHSVFEELGLKVRDSWTIDYCQRGFRSETLLRPLL